MQSTLLETIGHDASLPQRAHLVRPRHGHGRSHVRNRHHQVHTSLCGYCGTRTIERPKAMSSMGRRAMLTSPRVYTSFSENLTSGTTWAAPANMQAGTLYVEAIGGGAGARSATFLGNSGGGGGGGAYAASSDTTVAPGQTGVPYAIGGGGTGSVFNTATGLTAGGDTSWNTNVVIAKGGAVSNGGVGGSGGLASASTGTTKADGQTGSNGVGGANAGGGKGGNGASGGSMTGGAGGAAGDGIAGTAPGGGGGGGQNTTGHNGGNGAIGRITLTYTLIT